MRKLYNSLRLLLVILLGAIGNASAQSTISYGYTGGLQTYVVPVGIEHVIVNAKGASGGYNSRPTVLLDSPGHGACVVCTLTVSVGQVLNIYVGQKGGDGTSAVGGAGGYNGGAAGGHGASSVNSGGGGGGASDIRVGGVALGNRVIVAGGGGGAGLNCGLNNDKGGDGGGTTGQNGNFCIPGSGTSSAGGGGTPSAGGAGGTCTSCTPSGPSSAGTLGNGGAVITGSAGGGGGAGYYGGGGGQWNGGGGGSSYTDATLVSGVTHTRGCQTNSDGVVTITPICTVPAITGTMNVCMGLTQTLSNGYTGGTWTSSNTGLATVGSLDGVVTGVSAGSVFITYTYGPCQVTTPFVVNRLPLPITGSDSVCVGSTTDLNDVDGTSTWTSSNTAVATIGSSTGTVTGVSAGTSLITFTAPITGCIITRPMRVDPLPGPITGMDSICEGSTTILSNSAGGGTWATSNIGIATIGTTTGDITGVFRGTVTVTYTLPTGCLVTRTERVDPLPLPIAGVPVVCVGLTTTLTDPGGGTWASSDITIATVGSSSGVVTGVHAGTAVVTYTLPTTCYVTTTVLVNPLPGPIRGGDSLCAGLTFTLTNDSIPGTWTSSNIAIATIDIATGVVTGVMGGTVTITYTLPTGCIATLPLRINPLPAPITGAPTVCRYSATTLSSATLGGVWTSSDITVASVGSSTGVVTGVTAGTAMITYTLGTGCITVSTMSVNPLAVIVGPSVVCATDSILLSDTVTGGVWTSSDIARALVDPVTGMVYGVAAGVVHITYTLPTGCFSTHSVTVNPLDPITGTPRVCVGLTTTLANVNAGGSWTSSDLSICTIGTSSGIVTGVAEGTATITYTLPTGCTSYLTFSVDPLSPITGTTAVCVGLTTALADATPGGLWTSSDLAVATVDAFGVVTGVSFGTSIITYHLPTGCEAYTTISVSPLAAIGGTPHVCEGLTTTLTDAVPGGSWSSSDDLVATIGSTTGIATGVVAGTAIITYSLGTGCAAYLTLTVDISPLAVTGTDSLCVGLTTLFSDATFGGTWSSSDVGVAFVNPLSGVITGTGAGTAIITYNMPGSCISTRSVTVNPLPAAITGTTSVCLGYTTTLSDASAGGTWTSSNYGTGDIDAITGVVTGVGIGTAIITYTLPTGCIATTIVTIQPVPAAITGTFAVCVGQTTTLSDVTPLGTWTSSDLTVATVGLGTGIVTGVAAGTSTITYTVTSTGCFALATVTVNPLTPITGTLRVCVGDASTLSNATGGGEWSSSNTFVATVGSTSGVFTGVNAGTATISYILPTGCMATITVSVSPLPAAIAGVTTICVGLTSTLTDATGGGTWSSSDIAVATIGSLTGTVTGLFAGTAIITYRVTTTGCYITTIATIYDLAPIVGVRRLCLGETTTLTDPAPGGTWSSGNIGVATIGSSTGDVVAVGVGTSIISYTLPTGCRSVMTLTVNPLPFFIAGPTSVCENASVTLTDVTGSGPGFLWSSSDIAVATIGSISGVVNGVTAGTSTITFTVASTGCYRTTVFTVNPIPAPIGGPSTVCQFSTITLTDASAGGTWMSSNTAVGTIGSTTGDLYGVTAGTTTVTYAFTATGCYITTSVTVYPVPAITGPTAVCEGSTITATESIGGGTWSSSDDLTATVGSTTGVITGVVAGTVTITYTFTTGCIALETVTVHPLPAAISAPIATTCQGSSITFTDPTPGGTWSSSDILVATVGSLSGVVTGTGGGTATITYRLATGCYTTTSVNINPVTPITGIFRVCIGLTTDLNDATPGGTWSSSNTAVGTIDAAGIVTGISVGTTVITYMLPTGCSAQRTVTVNPLPLAITGPTVVCTGSTITLSDPSGAGTWSSSNTGVATVGSLTGVVTGVGAGTTIITFTLPTTCIAVVTVTVNASPAAIAGSSSVCYNLTTTLTDATPGGLWSSSNTGVATIGSTSGVVFGASVGTSIITYAMPNGCYRTLNFTVNSLPSAITGATFIVCAASTIRLSDATTGGVWSSSNIGVATVVGAGPGLGDVTGVSAGTAIITYSLGTGCTAVTTVTVLPQPIALITPLSDTFVCPGDFVELTASTDPVYSYQWYNGALPIAGATNATYTAPDVTALYRVVVTSGSTGCSRTSTPMNVIVSPVTATITTPGGTIGCARTGITLNANIGVGLTYQWEESGIPISGATGATYTTTVTGTFDVRVTNATGCSATSLPQPITINPSPTGLVTLSGPLTFCANDTLKLTAESGAGLTYQWSNLGGPIPGAIDSVLYVTTGNTYRVTVTNTFGCTTTSANIVAVTRGIPSATITAVGSLAFCTGGSVTLSAPGGPGLSYQWFKNGVAISGAVGAVYVATTTGDYTVRVTNGFGCVVTTITPTSVTVLSVPTVVPITPKSFCWGGSSRLSAVVVGSTSLITYQWYFNGSAIPGATSSTYNANVPGDYSCDVYAPTGCFLSSLPVSVTENPLPNPRITFDGMVFHTGTFYRTYQWYKNGIAIVGGTTSSTPATGDGSYKVGVTDSNGCQSISDIYVLTGWSALHNVGVSAVANNLGVITIFPNPAQDMVNIESPEEVRAIVSSIDGKELMRKDNAKTLDISSLANGIYIIKLYDVNGQMVKTEKLLKTSK